MPAAMASVFPPGAAQASRIRSPAFASATSPTICDASSCTTNRPSDASGESRGLPRVTIRPSGANGAGCVSTPACCERLCELVARDAQAVGAQRQRRRLVVEPAPGLGRLEPVPRSPALHQPSRMRQRLLEIVDLAGGIAHHSRRQRQAVPLAARPPEQRVHERRGARLAGLLRHLHGVVDRGRRRHPIEMEQLKQRQPEDVDDFAVQHLDRTAGVGGDEDVERALPAQRSGGDLAGKRAVAFVLEVGSGADESRGQVRAAGADRPQHVVRCEPRRRNHGSKVIPGRVRYPARNSRLLNTRRPSGCSCRICSVPLAVATISRSPAASTIVPGPAATV